MNKLNLQSKRVSELLSTALRALLVSDEPIHEAMWWLQSCQGDIWITSTDFLVMLVIRLRRVQQNTVQKKT